MTNRGSVNPLSYAPSVPWHKRGRYRRAGWLFLIGITGVIGWCERNELAHRSTLIYWQSQCRNYSAPANQIVYFSGGQEPVFKLVSAIRGYRIRRQSFNAVIDAEFQMDAWDKLRDLAYPHSFSGAGLFGGAPEVNASRSQVIISSLLTDESPAALFLHERRASNGISRLVIVTIEPGMPFGDWWHLTAMSAETKTFGGLGALKAGDDFRINRSIRDSAGSYHHDIQTACFFAGQVTAHNSSGFAIAYELDGAEGIIDGDLDSDGLVKLRVRNGPATMRGAQTVWPTFAKPDVPTPISAPN